MFRTVLTWFGLIEPAPANHRRHDRRQSAHHRHVETQGHTHALIDPRMATTERGIRAVKWSLFILALTSGLELAVVLASGSVALLADTIHNLGDALTAVPLWTAFRLARRSPSNRFTYGLGRVEDLAGLTIVAIMLASTAVAGWEAASRLLDPRPIDFLWAVAAAGGVGFLGNEAVAVLRVRVGREIDSAALIADGHHARIDGLMSLAVVAGAAGVWLGFPLADPAVGLLITIAMLGIVRQSAIVVFTRLLDGVDPKIIEEIRHAAEHVDAVRRVLKVRARWVGHRLSADLDVAVSGGTTVAEAEVIVNMLERSLADHIAALSSAHVRVRPNAAPGEAHGGGQAGA